MVLIGLAVRCHEGGELFKVVMPDSGIILLQLCRFLIRKKNILISAVGSAEESFALTLSLSLFIYLYIFLYLFLSLRHAGVTVLSHRCHNVMLFLPS